MNWLDGRSPTSLMIFAFSLPFTKHNDLTVLYLQKKYIPEHCWLIIRYLTCDLAVTVILFIAVRVL